MVRAQVIRHGDIDMRFPERDPQKYKLRLLAEGDSWFTLGAIPSSNLLYHITTSKPAALVTIAKPGDTIVRMGDPDRMFLLRKLITIPQFAYAWDALLLSGGGNDLIDEAPEIVRAPPQASQHAADYVDPVALSRLRGNIQTAYRAIVDLRDADGSLSKGKPIYVHTYDYPTPRDSPTRFLGAGIKGPWLYPVFLLHVPPSLWVALADLLLDWLADTLLALDTQQGSTPLPTFHVIDTRDTLRRARLDTVASDGDWANEIHPNTGGYKKIGAKLSARIAL